MQRCFAAFVFSPLRPGEKHSMIGLDPGEEKPENDGKIVECIPQLFSKTCFIHGFPILQKKVCDLVNIRRLNRNGNEINYFFTRLLFGFLSW